MVSHPKLLVKQFLLILWIVSHPGQFPYFSWMVSYPGQFPYCSWKVSNPGQFPYCSWMVSNPGHGTRIARGFVSYKGEKGTSISDPK